MIGAKYIGQRKWIVKVGKIKVKQGMVVGEPGSGAQIEGCPGVVEWLLRRGDFERFVDGDDLTPPEIDENTLPVEADAKDEE